MRMNVGVNLNGGRTQKREGEEITGRTCLGLFFFLPSFISLACGTAPTRQP